MTAAPALRAAALLGGVLLGVTPAVAQSDTPAALVGAARAITREVAAMRGLEVVEPVDFRVSDRPTIRRYARESLDREMPPEQWEAYDALLTHAGLIGPEIDLEGLVLSLYAEQIAGYYDPRVKTFYLADWLPRLLQRAVVAHEVTHALQDQHFDLVRWLEDLPPTEDGSLARAAVVEGDAMAAMLAYLLEPTGMDLASLPDIGALMAGQTGSIGQAYPAFDAAPTALQRLLLFPYVEGAEFVLTAFREGGWPAVDDLYRDPPASTEQILHPERYWEARDDPRAVATPPGPPDAAPWMEGSWGQFGVSLVLEAALGDSAAARRAATGWDGDRYALYRGPRGRTILAWTIVWDSPQSAERFARTYAQAFARRSGGGARIETGRGRISFEGGDHSLSMTWAGDTVVLRDER